MDEKLKEISPILEKYEQSHLLNFYDDLTEKQKENLIEQIKETNFSFLNKLYVNSFKNKVIEKNRIKPIDYYSIFDLSQQEKEEYINLGKSIIANGKLAVITLAGGMGSRLGFKGPKGTYELQLPPDEKRKSLFEFICDKLKYANEKYNCCIPWYIMTSPSNDEKTKENPSDNEKQIILEAEGDRLLKHIKENDYVISLEILGNKLDSVKFSKKIENLGLTGNSNIVFVIGGSLGLDQRISKRADYKISFSDMTFPHQLMRVVLLEQIYRGFRIMRNEPYHK